MSLKLLRDGKIVEVQTSEEKTLASFCDQLNFDVKLEWIDGQYWLHSDIEKERPIGIEIDKELKRHEEFFKRSSLQKELLAKAIGVKGPKRPKVNDLTAGLLGDTLLFLSFGCEVEATERNPIIAFLIQSALKNAQHPALSRLKFYHQDALSFLQERNEFEVIYYDPMFEDANEKSSPRKEMRIFRVFIGKDQDVEEVLRAALEKNAKRVVVKRPKHSAHISFSAPLEFTGKATRYDVYLGQNPRTFESNPVE